MAPSSPEAARSGRCSKQATLRPRRSESDIARGAAAVQRESARFSNTCSICYCSRLRYVTRPSSSSSMRSTGVRAIRLSSADASDRTVACAVVGKFNRLHGPSPATRSHITSRQDSASTSFVPTPAASSRSRNAAVVAAARTRAAKRRAGSRSMLPPSSSHPKNSCSALTAFRRAAGDEIAIAKSTRSLSLTIAKSALARSRTNRRTTLAYWWVASDGDAATHAATAGTSSARRIPYHLYDSH